MAKGDLSRILLNAERDLKKLLEDESAWQSLDVNYEPPRVQRLWVPYQGDYRLYLHRIHPCGRPLFHPHPWPSAIRVVSGEYEMGLGYGPGDKPPPMAATLILTAGCRYEMLDPDGWHYVKPIDEPSLSIMITGKPWKRWAPGPKEEHKLEPLNDADRQLLFADFRKYYP
jgi:hypothetical protein